MNSEIIFGFFALVCIVGGIGAIAEWRSRRKRPVIIRDGRVQNERDICDDCTIARTSMLALALVCLTMGRSAAGAEVGGFTPPPFVAAPQGAVRLLGVGVFDPIDDCEALHDVQPCMASWENGPIYQTADNTSLGKVGYELIQVSVPIALPDSRYRLICVEAGRTLRRLPDFDYISEDAQPRCYVERWHTVGVSAGHVAVVLPVERRYTKTTEAGREPDMVMRVWWMWAGTQEVTPFEQWPGGPIIHAVWVGDPFGMPADASRIVLEPTPLASLPTWSVQQ